MPITLKPGDRFPDLTLPDQDGQPLALSQVAEGRPLVLTLYRGPW